MEQLQYYNRNFKTLGNWVVHSDQTSFSISRYGFEEKKDSPVNLVDICLIFFFTTKNAYN